MYFRAFFFFKFEKTIFEELIFFQKGLTIDDLKDLLADIEVYSDLEAGLNAGYWRDMTIIAEDELKKLEKLDKHSKGLSIFDDTSFNILKSPKMVQNLFSFQGSEVIR
jgi:hypothetical protein